MAHKVRDEIAMDAEKLSRVPMRMYSACLSFFDSSKRRIDLAAIRNPMLSGRPVRRRRKISPRSS